MFFRVNLICVEYSSGKVRTLLFLNNTSRFHFAEKCDPLPHRHKNAPGDDRCTRHDNNIRLSSAGARPGGDSNVHRDNSFPEWNDIDAGQQRGDSPGLGLRCRSRRVTARVGPATDFRQTTYGRNLTSTHSHLPPPSHRRHRRPLHRLTECRLIVFPASRVG